MIKIYTVNYRRTDGSPGWTSIWASSVKEAKRGISARQGVESILSTIPNE